ncbi:MAG: PP2C family serine/threonine-protein phosphatase [Pseudomonadota bacterium]
MPWITGGALAIGSRNEQQDRVAILSSENGQRHLLALADGMGGHQGGALAAQAVVDTAGSLFSGQALDDPHAFLETLCLEAHHAICGLGADETLSPGSTCAVLYLNGREAYWAHVGDSRLYHYRCGRVLNRTSDHSVRQLMLNQGAIEKNSEAAGAFQNQLYRRLGGGNLPEPDFGATAVESGDLFVLCSDGFWQAVDADQVVPVLGAHDDAKNGAEALVQFAVKHSAEDCDNISVALARWTDDSLSRRGVFSSLKQMLSFLSGRTGCGQVRLALPTDNFDSEVAPFSEEIAEGWAADSSRTRRPRFDW